MRNQIHLLRGYADPTTKTLTDRLRMPPSDRIGLAPIWELFGGNSATGKLIWASAPDYGLRILAMYSDALVFNGANPACLPYFPGANDTKSGNGYWVVNSDSGVFSYGSAQYYGNTMALRLNQPLINGESLSSGLGYWLLALDGGIFSFGAAQFYGSTGNLKLNQPINGMERTDNDGGYWLVAYDGGVFSFGNAPFFGSTGGIRLNKPVLGMERTKSGRGYWLFASDGGIFSFGDAPFFGSLGAQTLPAPIVSMQRTPSGNGYWMLGADGKIYAFGDAANLGDIVGCKNYLGAQRLLVTPSGGGYWIATRDGSVVAFGDARRLGFPTRIGVPRSDCSPRNPRTRQRGRLRSSLEGLSHPWGARVSRAERVATRSAHRRRPLEPAPDNAGGGRDDMADARRVCIVLAGGDPVDASLRAVLPHDAYVVAADSGLYQAAVLGLARRPADRRPRLGRRRRGRCRRGRGNRGRTSPRGQGRHGPRARARTRARRGRRTRHRRRRCRWPARPLRRERVAPRIARASRRRGSTRASATRASRVVRGGEAPAELEGRAGSLVTLLPVGGPALGVVTDGLQYPLHREALGPGTSRGVSNVLVGRRASVALDDGTLLVVQPFGGDR